MPKQYKNQTKNRSARESYEVTSEEIDQKKTEVKQKMVGHNWRQQGTRVFCTSCPTEHAFSVEPDKILIDVKEGMPVFDKR